MCIKVLYIRTNNSCNSHCFMCDFWKNPDISMKKKQFENIIRNMGGVRMIRFTGGEPLLCGELPFFINYCHEIGIKTSIITNGLILNEKIDDLVTNGLDQVVFSIDGSSPKLHDSLRGVSGLFCKIEYALNRINKEYPQLKIRVNTVVSEKNINDLPTLAIWLDRHYVQQWSIIPIKIEGYRWCDNISFTSFKNAYDRFQSAILDCRVELMGYSSNWVNNIEDFWQGKLKIRPKGLCHLSRMVAYYNPFSNSIYPCNCLPHRKDSNSCDALWYYQHGKEQCEGCEPLNAWASDNPKELESDIFKI